MLYYLRIEVSECTDVNKKSVSNRCIICHYWFFSDKEFTFQLSLCDGCHKVLMMAMYLNDSAVLNICAIDYLCIINGTGKGESRDLFKKNACSSKKSRSL